MLRINRDKLAVLSVQGTVADTVSGPTLQFDRKEMDAPSVGSICYSHQIGDRCCGFACEHVEPGVSTFCYKGAREDRFNIAYNRLSCIGNRARVVTGDAKGSMGFVTGKHGGANHVMIWFDNDTLEKLTNRDEFLIKTEGHGLELLDYPQIKVHSLDPDLLNKMNIREESGKLIVPVAKRIPAWIIGAGYGYGDTAFGDIDLSCGDRETLTDLGLDDLRYGDLVFMEDNDHTYGRGIIEGACTIGVVIHGDSYIPGHGPGITTILSSREPVIECEISNRANIAYMLGVKK